MFTFSSTREDEEEKDEETEGENCLQLQDGNQNGPREQGPLGRETACYGEHSGLEDFTRDVCVRGVQSGEEQIKPDCVTLKFLLLWISGAHLCAHLKEAFGARGGSQAKSSSACRGSRGEVSQEG